MSSSVSEKQAEAGNTQYQNIALQIESLSGVFGDLAYQPQGHLITNDRGMDVVIPQVRERLQQTPAGGVGIFIGSAGLTSMLPDLKIDVPVVVDTNDAVFEFSALLNQTILTDRDVLCRLDDQSAICRYVAGILGSKLGGTTTSIIGYQAGLFGDAILSEAKRFGEEHWSNPGRIELVANALAEKPPIYVAADIAHPGFIMALSAICRQQAATVKFANFTNVHEYVPGSDMSFLQDLLDPDAVVMYSFDDGAPLQARVASSLDEYIQVTGASWDHLMKDADWAYNF